MARVYGGRVSYIAKCLCCGCPIYMQDDFDEADERICEECRTDKTFLTKAPQAKDGE